MTKILFIGLGAIGQRHVRNLRSVYGNKVELLAYRLRNLPIVLNDRMQVEPDNDLQSKYDIRIYDSLEAALAQKPDIAFICNPSSMHLPIAMQAVQAGCHLFIEKPLSHNLEGVNELAQLLSRSSLVGYVGYQMRFHPCLRRLHELLERSVVGKVLAVRIEVGEYLPNWHTYEDYRQSYASRRDLGGGALLSQIHEFDYLYWNFGLPRRLLSIGGHLSSLEIDVDDVVSTLMECYSGGYSFPVHVQQDYIQRPPSRTCQVIGESGKILVDLNALSVDRYDNNGQLIEETSYAGFQRNQLFLDELKHFMACVRGEETPLVDVSEGAQSLRIAIAARKSLESGEMVSL